MILLIVILILNSLNFWKIKFTIDNENVFLYIYLFKKIKIKKIDLITKKIKKDAIKGKKQIDIRKIALKPLIRVINIDKLLFDLRINLGNSYDTCLAVGSFRVAIFSVLGLLSLFKSANPEIIIDQQPEKGITLNCEIILSVSLIHIIISYVSNYRYKKIERKVA